MKMSFDMEVLLEIQRKTVIITRMKRFLIILSSILFISIISTNLTLATEPLENIQLEMRGYDEITLPAGTFIPVLNTQEISTETCPVGYKVKFIATNDLFMYETNIIPRNTEFYG